MQAIVVYESHWGSTAAIARAIAAGIGPGARLLSTAEAAGDAMAGVDLIVAGAPLIGFALPSEVMLASMAADAVPQLRAAQLVASQPALLAGAAACGPRPCRRLRNVPLVVAGQFRRDHPAKVGSVGISIAGQAAALYRAGQGRSAACGRVGAGQGLGRQAGVQVSASAGCGPGCTIIMSREARRPGPWAPGLYRIDQPAAAPARPARRL